ncbi:hypothetical protein BGX23_006398 [Mortierella sp. AD031]|nr:hypothetical protein BGX23_006398 [Mortierella sp. AD031]
MAHLIDPCLRATKIAHGIRRGIDGLSPLSGLVPELRILIQEQKNVLTSLKRTTFEKVEAAKHLAIYAKTEGPDLADTLSKLSVLIRKAADLERDYADSLGQSRELFKEVRVAEDNNYSIRKRKLDLEHKLASTSSSSTSSAVVSITGATTALVSQSRSTSPGPQELHPEMRLLRKETMTTENELEDMKRKNIKRATAQQLDALEKLGKELIVIAYYGREIMDQVDDTPTEAGQHADDRYGQYDGAAKTAYSLKACLDTFKDWPTSAPIVQMQEVDMGDFPKDTKGAMDAMLHDLAVKTGSDWYDLQQPSPTSTTSSLKRPGQHTRSSSTSSTTSTIRSQRDSMSSEVTTVTYVDGVPMVQVINEIPPTPDNENGPIVLDSASTTSTTTTTSSATAPSAQEPIPIFIASQSAPETDDAAEAVATATTTTTGAATPMTGASTPKTGATTPTTAPASPTITATSTSPIPAAATQEHSPFIPHSTYTPSTTYQPGHDHTQGAGAPTRPRPMSSDRYAIPAHGFHAPHPLMMQHQPQYPPGPPAGGMHHPSSQLSMSMPMPTHGGMPLPMQMPVPHIPGSPDPHYPYSNDFSQQGGNKRHSNPISVSFPVRQPQGSPSSDHGSLPVSISSSPGLTSAPRPQGPRGPQAILPPTEPGFRIPVGAEMDDDCDDDDELMSCSVPGGGRRQGHPQVYDGPPPDYAEAAMQPPAEKLDEKKRR